MSATRPPARFPEHERQPGAPEALDELSELEELGDEAIISQQTAAHALQPRANVSEESRSVVITEHAQRLSEPPRNPPKSSAEATLVIRDRRALDEMRKKILRKQQQKRAHKHHALYLWGGLGLAAFVLGGIVAFLATETHADSPTALSSTPATPTEARALSPADLAAKPAPESTASGAPPAVRLDELPVEPRTH